MAQKVKFHGKYKGVIVSRTDVKKLRDKLELGRGKLVDLLVENMCHIGEAAVAIARKTGDYNDITGNLRSSIGYIVLSNGTVCQQSVPDAISVAHGKRKVKRKRKDGTEYTATQKVGGDGKAGAEAGKRLLDKLKAEYPYGVVLILCAGMEYAAFVENVRGKHVLIDAELEAYRLIDKFLGKYIKSV